MSTTPTPTAAADEPPPRRPILRKLLQAFANAMAQLPWDQIIATLLAAMLAKITPPAPTQPK